MWFGGIVIMLSTPPRKRGLRQPWGDRHGASARRAMIAHQSNLQEPSDHATTTRNDPLPIDGPLDARLVLRPLGSPFAGLSLRCGLRP